jgi:hypothetical protein
MHLKHLTVGTAVFAALLVAAPAGVAQTAAQRGYSAPAGSVQQQIGHDDPSARVDAASDDAGGGGLPFSGLDLGLLAGAGGILLATGLGVRRLVGSSMR